MDSFFVNKLLCIQNEIQDILDFDCFNQEKDKDDPEDALMQPIEFLCNSDVASSVFKSKKYGLQVMCQNLSNNSFSEFEKLYKQTDIREIYLFTARSNAIHYSNKTRPKSSN